MQRLPSSDAKRTMVAFGPPTNASVVIGSVVCGVVLPIVLIPIIRVTGFSEVIEEVAKALVVYAVIIRVPEQRAKKCYALLFGVLFGISENMLYLNQIMQLGALGTFALRFVTVMPMHGFTAWIEGFGGERFGGKGVMIATVLAIAVHMAFNALMVSVLH